MISVLLLAFARSGGTASLPGDAVRTLASLVPATVEGLVRDLCLVGPAGADGLADVADHAGCSYLAAATTAEAIRLGSQRLRCPLAVVVRSGMVLDRAVLEELAALLPTLADGRGTLVLKAMRHDWVGRLFPATGETAAVLAPRSWLENSGASTIDQLGRGGQPRRVLRSRAWLG